MKQWVELVPKLFISSISFYIQFCCYMLIVSKTFTQFQCFFHFFLLPFFIQFKFFSCMCYLHPFMFMGITLHYFIYCMFYVAHIIVETLFPSFASLRVSVVITSWANAGLLFWCRMDEFWRVSDKTKLRCLVNSEMGLEMFDTFSGIDSFLDIRIKIFCGFNVPCSSDKSIGTNPRFQ